MVWSNRGKSGRAKISDRGAREDPRPTVDLRNERFRPVAFVCGAGRLERTITDEVMTSDLRQSIIFLLDNTRRARVAPKGLLTVLCRAANDKI